MILLGTLYSAAATITHHIPYSDRVVGSLAQVLAGDVDAETDDQDTVSDQSVDELDSFGIATGFAAEPRSKYDRRPAIDERLDKGQKPALCYHTHCDTCDLLPSPSSFGINKLANRVESRRTLVSGPSTPAANEPPPEFVAAQNSKFDDLVSRNLESLELTPKWWTPFQSPRVDDIGKFERNDSGAYLPSPPETAQRSQELDFLVANLSRDTKEHLLHKLQDDLEERGSEHDIMLEDVPFIKISSSENYMEKLDRFVHLCVLLTILVVKASIPYLQSLYLRFKEDRLYLLNRKNLARIADIVLSLMQALEASLKPGSKSSPWQVLSQRLVTPKKLAKQIISNRLASGKPEDDTRVGKWRRAAVEYVIKSYLDSPHENQPENLATSTQTTFGARDSAVDYAQYFSPSYHPQKAFHDSFTANGRSELLFNDVLQRLAQEL